MPVGTPLTVGLHVAVKLPDGRSTTGTVYRLVPGTGEVLLECQDHGQFYLLVPTESVSPVSVP